MEKVHLANHASVMASIECNDTFDRAATGIKQGHTKSDPFLRHDVHLQSHAARRP